MVYQSKHMEEQAVLQTVARMCAAARTAPKAYNRDIIHTLVLTGEDKDALVEKMIEVGIREFGEGNNAWYNRDADNVRQSQAVVLIGIQHSHRGVPRCGFCGFADCAACREAGGNCAICYMDLGIALSSAALIANADLVDNRIMFSIGKAAMEMAYLPEPILWQGIPLSVSGKSIFFDRPRKS